MKKLLLIMLWLFSLSAYAGMQIDLIPGQKKQASQNLVSNNRHIFVQHPFSLSVNQIAPNQYLARWKLSKGVFLYRDKIHIAVAHPGQAVIDKIILPDTTIDHKDEFFGKTRVYAHKLIIPFTLKKVADVQTSVRISYQGCAIDGTCYPPEVQTFDLKSLPTVEAVVTHRNYLGILSNNNFMWSLFVFLGLGLLLTFTPCVLPMIPILSGIITGQKNNSAGKAFKLSLAYVISMALTYAIIGMVAGSIGASLQTLFQRPWIIALMSVIFLLLALSMFGLFNLSLPAGLQNKLNQMSNRQKRGSYIGVVIMGILATLILSPCVTPPLIATLTYISQTGNILFGGLALFFMGIGMGIPLILFGTANGALVPKAGRWMQVIKNIAGVMLLAMSWWTLGKIIPGLVATFILAILLIILSVYLDVFSFKQRTSVLSKFQHAMSIVILIYGSVLMVGVLMGNNNLFKPLMPNFRFALEKKQNELSHKQDHFIRVTSLPALNKELLSAKRKNKFVFLDFSADWCPDCQYMTHNTFRDKRIKKALKQFILIRADLTKNNVHAREIMKRFNVIGPPVMLFYNRDGELLEDARIVGVMGADALLKNITQVIQSP